MITEVPDGVGVQGLHVRDEKTGETIYLRDHDGTVEGDIGAGIDYCVRNEFWVAVAALEAIKRHKDS